MITYQGSSIADASIRARQAMTCRALLFFSPINITKSFVSLFTVFDTLSLISDT